MRLVALDLYSCQVWTGAIANRDVRHTFIWNEDRTLMKMRSLMHADAIPKRQLEGCKGTSNDSVHAHKWGIILE